MTRAIGRTPESIRRLLTAKSVNPQLRLVSEIVSVLGYRVTLALMTAAQRKETAVSPDRHHGYRGS